MPQNPIVASHRVFLSLGSNLESRFRYLQEAVRALREIAEVVRVSGVYETVPFGYTDQPEFLNAAAEIQTTMAPFELLSALKAVEQRLGRKERPRWHEREIDFDILFYDDLHLLGPRLTIPHPELQRRAFVLVPLAEIDPNFVHPVLQLRISELLGALGEEAAGVRKTSLEIV